MAFQVKIISEVSLGTGSSRWRNAFDHQQKMIRICSIGDKVIRTEQEPVLGNQKHNCIESDELYH